LGYENASGFITMFRKAVGQPPARYLADCAGVSTSAAAPAAIALHSLLPLDQR
jgi:AraC-like DNA-binding protein